MDFIDDILRSFPIELPFREERDGENRPMTAHLEIAFNTAPSLDERGNVRTCLQLFVFEEPHGKKNERSIRDIKEQEVLLFTAEDLSDRSRCLAYLQGLKTGLTRLAEDGSVKPSSYLPVDLLFSMALEDPRLKTREDFDAAFASESDHLSDWLTKQRSPAFYKLHPHRTAQARDFEIAGFVRTTAAPQIAIERRIADFVDLRRTAYRLHPRPGHVERDESKMGGLFLWDRARPWPECDFHPGSPLMGILQLRRRDVPDLLFPEGKDLFQLFWCPAFHSETSHGPCVRTFWSRAADTLDPVLSAKLPIVGEESLCPSECRLHPEAIIEYPMPCDLSPGLLEKLQSEGISELYERELCVAPGTKLLGHPNWVQGSATPLCDCGSRMKLLFTLDTLEFDRKERRWIPLEERPIVDKTDWNAVWRSGLVEPTEIVMGDMGRYFLFCCTTCEEWPVRGFTDCR